ncbi:MAG: PAS domain S-box protein [bacterium]|nr:PAS domain S-box protein [bacterium]
MKRSEKTKKEPASEKTPTLTQELFDSVVKNVPDFIFTVDRKGAIQFINRLVPSLTYEQVLGSSSFDYVDKEYRPIMKKAFARVFKTGKTQTYEVEGPAFEGGKAWYRSNVGPIRKDKKIVALTVVSTDVTEQKRVAEELQISHAELEKRVFDRTVDLQKTNEALRREIEDRERIENHLEEEKNKMDLIYNHTRDGLTLYDKEGRVVYTNPSLEKLFGIKTSLVGVTREEILKHRDKYFAHFQERSDDSWETQKKVFSGQAVTNIMIKVHSHPVKYIEANYIPIVDRAKNVLGMIGSFRDVSILKAQAEEIGQNLLEVERQRNRWEAIFENVEEGIYIMDKDMKILAMNGACELMAGIEEKEAIGKYAYEVFGCHDAHGHYFPEFSPARKVYQTLEPIPYDEHIHSAPEGTERWVGTSYTPILGENRKVIQCIGVIRDITGLKELDVAKSEFVSIASHELRTPLTVINGYLSLILNGDLGDPAEEVARHQQFEAIRKVYKETKRLTGLVEELLNVSRIEEGRLKLRLRKVNLTELIREVFTEMKPLADSLAIDLDLDLDRGSDGKLVLVDRDKMKQVLMNLIDNAIKYNREHGKVKIRTQIETENIVTVVEDNGVGIPPSLQAKIFEKFQQVPGSYIKENRGTGLGLFIVKSLVEMHGGRLTLVSTPGSGSVFSFGLPVVALQS